MDHHRAIREIERRDLVKIVDEFGLQLLLQPIREPPSIIKDEMTVSTICNEEVIITAIAQLNCLLFLLVDLRFQNIFKTYYRKSNHE